MTKLVGIVNLTPDSFSDGAMFTGEDIALTHMENLANAGAEILDIGAESTRPGATPITPEQEWQRLEPVLAELNPEAITLSLDSRNVSTVEKALPYIHWVNDVTGFKNDAMLELVANSGKTLVAMHSLSVPADKNVTLPQNCNVTDEIKRWAETTLERFTRYNVSKERIILDVGIGFGKTPAQNWQLIKEAHKLVDTIPVAWLYGHSRKGFLEVLHGSPADERDPETFAVSMILASQNVQYLRVHEVATQRKMLNSLQFFRSL